MNNKEYRKQSIDAYYLPFQSYNMSQVFLVDTIKCLMVGGRVLQVEVFHSRLDLMAKMANKSITIDAMVLYMDGWIGIGWMGDISWRGEVYTVQIIQ